MFIDVHSNMGKPIECNANTMLRQTGDTQDSSENACAKEHAKNKWDQ